MMFIMMIDERHAFAFASIVVFDVVRSSRQTYKNHMSRRNRKSSNVVDVASNVDVVASRVESNDVVVDDTNVIESNVTNVVNAIDALNVVANEQRNDERATHVAKLLHALYNDESLSSHDKKTIRRTLRDTYNYYISRERRRNASNVVASILSRDAS